MKYVFGRALHEKIPSCQGYDDPAYTTMIGDEQ